MPMENGPEDNYDVSDLMQDTRETLDSAYEWAFGEAALSRLNVYRNGSSAERLRHVQEHPGDPEGLSYALELGASYPEAMMKQIEEMDPEDVKNMSPEEVERVRQNLNIMSRDLGFDMQDIYVAREQWRKANYELQEHGFKDKTLQDALAKADRGSSFSYEDIVKLGGLSETSRGALYHAMDSGSQLRFALTFPSEAFIEGEVLNRMVDTFNDQLPEGMSRMNEHAYSWNEKNPLRNPNLSAAQLDRILDAFWDVGCNRNNSRAQALAGGIVYKILAHPNASEATRDKVQTYQSWLSEARLEQKKEDS